MGQIHSKPAENFFRVCCFFFFLYVL